MLGEILDIHILDANNHTKIIYSSFIDNLCKLLSVALL